MAQSEKNLSINVNNEAVLLNPQSKLPKNTFPHRQNILMGLLLLLLCLAIFGRTVQYDFVIYDDGLYVVGNRHVQKGLTWENAVWAFTDTHTGNWHPLTWLSHMMDVHFFGMSPGMHHLMNVILHSLNTIFLFTVFLQMTRKAWPSAMVAALFAIHPLHVESVVWISERKDVLSTFFWMLTMLAYYRYTLQRTVMRYLCVVLSFCFGLLAKPMLVTLPFVLLLLDYWPLKRLQWGRDSKIENRSVVTCILEKLPLILLAVTAACIAIISQSDIHAMADFERFPIHVRLLNALVSYLMYIYKMVIPTHLAVFYPHPGMPSYLLLSAAIIVVFGMSAVAVMKWRTLPWWTVGWAWYVGTLVPVIGIVQVGLQAAADRYTYIPLIGLFIIAIWGGERLTARFKYGPRWAGITACLIIGILSIVTWRQVGYWANSDRLFTHALKVTEKNFLAHNAMGNIWAARGDYRKAVFHCTEAIRIRPEYAEAHYNLGHCKVMMKRWEEAEDHFKTALRIKPYYAQAHNYLGYVLMHQGALDSAAGHFKEAVRLKPELTVAYQNLGELSLRQQKKQAAQDYFAKAIEIQPNYYYAYYQLGHIFLEQGQMHRAIEAYSKVIELNRHHAGAHYRLGLAYEQRKQLDKAVIHFRSAIMIKPNFKAAQERLDAVLEKRKKNR
jgi:Tfp pilus assembly protein PilF